jgi:Caspase domain
VSHLTLARGGHVPRVALVVGNARYTTQATIPSAQMDAKLIADQLRDIDFKVTEVHDVPSQAAFYYLYLRPFLDSIEPGSVAAFYFSGHGFSFGGESYLTPTDFPATVPYSKITSTFMSVTAIRDMINERQPTVSLIVLDACRNMTNFIGTGQDKSRLQTKGLTAPPPAPVANTLIWFASDTGKVALASPGGAPSIYTGVLERRLNEEDRQIDLIRKEVRRDVMTVTMNQQIPWSSESSSAEVLLKPTIQKIEELKKIWVAQLEQAESANNRTPVQDFLEMYGSSPFAAAAKLWLQKHPDANLASDGSISPAAPESLWNNQLNAAVIPGPEGKNSALQFDGPFRMPSTLNHPDLVERRLWSPHLQGMELGQTIRLQPADAASILADQHVLVTSEAVDAQRSPERTVEKVLVPPGSSLRVDKVITGENNSRWLSVTTPDINGPLAIKVPESTSMTSWPIDPPAKEILVPPPRPDEPAALISDSPIVKAIDEIRSSKKVITWVSIATPPAVNAGEAKLLSLRANYAAHVLTTNGVPRTMISTVGESAPPTTGLRLRFFGKDQ